MYHPARTSVSTPAPPTSNSDATVEDDANSTSNSSSSGGPDYNWPPPILWNDMLDRPSDHTSTPNDPNAGFLDAFPGFSSCEVPLRDGEGEPQEHDIHPALLDLTLGMPFGGHMFDPNSSSSSIATSGNINIPIADKNGPDVGIALLSQLSTQLYPLHRSSCILAEAAAAAKEGNAGRVDPLIDEAALQCAASWLVHVSANMRLSFHTDRQYSPIDASTTGETLHGALCGAHQLLEILQCLQGKTLSGATAGTSTPNSTCSGCMKSGFRVQDIAPSPSSLSSNTVVRHLIIACHTLILNIFVGVLFALQHDADLRVAASMPAMGKNSADPATLADIRVVLIVQLYSYMFSRLHQAVKPYSTPATPTTPGHSHKEYFSLDLSPISTVSPLVSSEGISELEMEVQQRLTRLRQTLRF